MIAENGDLGRGLQADLVFGWKEKKREKKVESREDQQKTDRSRNPR